MLQATDAGYEPRRIVLEGPGAILGRCPSIPPSTTGERTAPPRLVKVTLDNGKSCINMSREHCRLERKGDEWALRDLGANNGVFINGERLPRLGVATLKNNALVKFTQSHKPSFEFRFTYPDRSNEKALSSSCSSAQASELQAALAEKERELSAFKTDVEKLVKCPVCLGFIRTAACLPCGHVFCHDCAKSSATCTMCQTKAAASSKGRGYAARCTPVDLIVALFTQKKDKPNKEQYDSVFIRVTDDDGEDDESTSKSGNKRSRAHQEEDDEGLKKKCQYCGEFAHEEGMRCPHRRAASEDEDEGSNSSDDLENMV